MLPAINIDKKSLVPVNDVTVNNFFKIAEFWIGVTTFEVFEQIDDDIATAGEHTFTDKNDSNDEDEDEQDSGFRTN